MSSRAGECLITGEMRVASSEPAVGGVRDSRNRLGTGQAGHRPAPARCTYAPALGCRILAILDQGGACGAAGPSVSAGLCRLGRPARRTSGRTARPPDQRGSHVMQTSARPAVLPRCSLSSPRSLPSPSQDPEASTLAASRWRRPRPRGTFTVALPFGTCQTTRVLVKALL
jgi:hypothetical protein